MKKLPKIQKHQKKCNFLSIFLFLENNIGIVQGLKENLIAYHQKNKKMAQNLNWISIKNNQNR
jgi:hypothetical protein